MAKSLGEQPSVQVHQAIAQSIPSAPITSIIFDTIDDNRFGMFDINTPNIVTIRESGWYSITGSVFLVAGATGTRFIYLVFNGGPIFEQNNMRPTILFTDRLNINSLKRFQQGDEILLRCAHTQGTAINTAPGTYEVMITLKKVGN